MITKLENINSITRAIPEEKAEDKKVYYPGASAFESIFRSAIDNVKETNAEFVNDQYLLATGQLDNPAALMIAGTKYQTSVDLLIQLRNKALDVYSELTRMSL